MHLRCNQNIILNLGNSSIIDDNICIVMIINITIVEIVRNVYCDTIDREYEYNIYIDFNYTVDDNVRLL